MQAFLPAFSLLMTNFNSAIQIVTEKLQSWIHHFIAMLPNFVIAVLVIIVFYLIARLVSKVLTVTLNKLSSNIAINKVIASFARIAIMLAAAFIALGTLELDKTVTSLLAGVGIAGLAIGFAFKDAIANLLSGLYITFKSTVNVGDIVEFGDHMGTVSSIGLRAVKIDTFQGQEVVIPNRLIFEDIYTHYTVNKIRRIDLNVGISYGDDLQHVEDITIAAIRKLKGLLPHKPVDLYFLEFGDSSINFEVRYWIQFNKQTDYLKALSDGIKNIKTAFDENNITIPFPIRTLDFGIKGGQTLSEMKQKVDIHPHQYSNS